MIELVMKIVGGIIAAAIGIFLFVFVLCALFTVLWADPACKAFGDGMQLKTEFRFWYGCFVTMPDKRILPKDVAINVLRQEYQFNVKQR